MLTNTESNHTESNNTEPTNTEPITVETKYIKNEYKSNNLFDGKFDGKSNTTTCESIEDTDDEPTVDTELTNEQSYVKLIDKEQSVQLPTQSIIIQTFRFKFSQEFTEIMSHFAMIHQFDDRVAFKEAWKSWTEEIYIASLINDEQKVLSTQGYEGNVLDKMFKSARYYYRKKKPDQEQQPSEAIPRKEYIGVSAKILECMDSYIKTKFLENTIKTKDNIIRTTISPANAYTDFNNIHKLQIDEEIEKLYIFQEAHNQCKLDAKEITIKFKKTFKNRYFIQSKNVAMSNSRNNNALSVISSS